MVRVQILTTTLKQLINLMRLINMDAKHVSGCSATKAIMRAPKFLASSHGVHTELHTASHELTEGVLGAH